MTQVSFYPRQVILAPYALLGRVHGDPGPRLAGFCLESFSATRWAYTGQLLPPSPLFVAHPGCPYAGQIY